MKRTINITLFILQVLTLLLLSLTAFGQDVTAKKYPSGTVLGDGYSGQTPKWETFNNKGTIELPADIQKKLVSLDSVIQSVNKQYREIVEPLQKQQQLIFEMAFSFKGVDVSKVDSVKYDKGIITYKVKQK
jgi:hypothetical protein